ncbi:hypothetical protein TNCV_2264561 [Trichonephila clavipes]|nr:hypothetical protein TNCV_2264561 [Trichonephila clavipes]
MSSGRSLPQINLGVQGGIQGDSHKLLCNSRLNIYCQQLDRLKLVTDQKRPELGNRRGVVFHQDNTRAHSSVVTRQKLWELA